MIILDSSCWLEYFQNGKHADHYATIIEGESDLIVPAIVLHEVFKVTMRLAGEGSALAVAGILQQFPIIPVDENVTIPTENGAYSPHAYMYMPPENNSCLTPPSPPSFSIYELTQPVSPGDIGRLLYATFYFTVALHAGGTL